VKYLPLLWSGIWRKPARTTLIILQVAVAFGLFGVLQGMKSGVDRVVADARGDLLVVHSRVSFADSLPLAYLKRIESVPGVKLVGIVDGLDATYRKPTQPVGVVAANLSQAWVADNVLAVSPQALRAFEQTRTGALITRGLAKEFGWKAGDRIPLLSGTRQSNGSGSWVFEVVGTFIDKLDVQGNDFILIHYDYLDAARQANKGTAARYIVVLSDPRQAATVADDIDRQFANSSNQTQTDSFRELAQSQMQAIGNLNFVIRSVIAAVLFASLFSTATMMTQSIRERSPELAVLKTLGFTDGTVFALIVAEAMAMCFAASVLGLSLAEIAFPFAAKRVPGIAMPLAVVEVGLAASLLVALLSVAAAAVRAARLEVVAALAIR
jgi:putative ABC transport system permease protein